jgi:hypothetical protein
MNGWLGRRGWWERGQCRLSHGGIYYYCAGKRVSEGGSWEEVEVGKGEEEGRKRGGLDLLLHCAGKRVSV